MRQISRRTEMIHLTIGWRRHEHGTHKHPHSSWILCSVSRVRSKTMHSLFCITSWLPYITLCYIDSRFFLPLEQSRTALLGCRLAASRLREAARWQQLKRSLPRSHSWSAVSINSICIWKIGGLFSIPFSSPIQLSSSSVNGPDNSSPFLSRRLLYCCCFRTISTVSFTGTDSCSASNRPFPIMLGNFWATFCGSS